MARLASDPKLARIDAWIHALAIVAIAAIYLSSLFWGHTIRVEQTAKSGTPTGMIDDRSLSVTKAQGG